MAKYLKALGYTAVEFLPVHEFANDLNPEGRPGWDRAFAEPPHGNYWGYMTYGFFAPDNAQYYALTEGNRYYWDSTGCGNNVDSSKEAVHRLIKDSC